VENCQTVLEGFRSLKKILPQEVSVGSSPCFQSEGGLPKRNQHFVKGIEESEKVESFIIT
jgi:hypothetical protein